MHYLEHTPSPSRDPDGGGVRRDVAGPVEPVVVVQVHQDGRRLAEHDAAPHDHIPDLPLGEGQGCDDTQGDLKGERESVMDVYCT